MTVPTTKGSRKQETPLPTSLPAIRPLVAGLDVGSCEHWCVARRERTASPTFGASGRRPAAGARPHL